MTNSCGGSEASWDLLSGHSGLLVPSASSSSLPASEAGSWQLLARQSSGPSSSACQEREAEPFAEEVASEAEPEEGCAGVLEGPAGTWRCAGQRDAVRRARQAARHGGPAPTQALQLQERRGERAVRRRGERLQEKLRVEERRFKRRFRDWCCFRGGDFGWLLKWKEVARRPVAVKAAKEAPRSTKKAAAADAAPAVGELSAMEAYARMAFWRALELQRGTPRRRTAPKLASAAQTFQRLLSAALEAAPWHPFKARRLPAMLDCLDVEPTRKAVAAGRKARLHRAEREKAARTAQKQRQGVAAITQSALRERQRAARHKARAAARDAKYFDDTSCCAIHAPAAPRRRPPQLPAVLPRRCALPVMPTPAAADDDVEGLISLWQLPAEELECRAPEVPEGRLLVPAWQVGGVAGREVFEQRFHGRTGGLFKGMDWRNLRAIGGMVLACLVADDATFDRCFPETDVDIYVVGLSGAAFQKRLAAAATSLYERAKAMGMQAALLRTPCTVTLSLRDGGKPRPNVQFIMAPFRSTRHLLTTTDIDCTGLGFDGEGLLATAWARDAVVYRRNLARPEKYCIRGEYSSECRLLKYAVRGFQVVDPGLPSDLHVGQHPELKSLAAEASLALSRHASGQARDGDSLASVARAFEQRVRATGVTGAELLLLAERYEGLKQLMLFDVPLLPAGLADERLLALLKGCDAAGDGYGFAAKRGRCRLRLLRTVPGMSMEAVVRESLQEMDPDSKPEVRSWYTGLEELLA